MEAEEPPGALGEEAIKEGPKAEGRVSLVRVGGESPTVN